MCDMTFSLFSVPECAYLAIVCTQMCVCVFEKILGDIWHHRDISRKDENNRQTVATSSHCPARPTFPRTKTGH